MPVAKRHHLHAGGELQSLNLKARAMLIICPLCHAEGPKARLAEHLVHDHGQKIPLARSPRDFVTVTIT